MITAEEWRAVVGFEGIYEVSNEGRIRSCEGKTTTSVLHGTRHWKQRILKPAIVKRKGGRADEKLVLCKDKKEYGCLVSRLVAMAWVDGYEQGLTVNHIDGNSLNNNAANLEWVSLKRNIQLGFETGLFRKKQKACALLDSDGHRYDFNSLREASTFLNRCVAYVSRCNQRHTGITDNTGRKYILVFRD